MDLSEVSVDIVAEEDEARFRDLMQAHHFLGAIRPVGVTLRNVARHRDRWLALAVFSAPALKCGARDRWICWDWSVQFGRLHLVSNNSRFLTLPGGPRNLGSRALALCARRLVRDWPARFGHEVLLLEALALDCHSTSRNGGFMEKANKIRRLLERTVFLPAPLHRARRARGRLAPLRN